MKTYISLSKALTDRPREPQLDTYPEELVETFLTEYTREGDVVLDPFAGFGTTLVVAERMGRHAIGVEIVADRAKFISSAVKTATVICGDARRIDELHLPPVDFSITSPPYMCIGDREDPLQGYAVDGQGYDAYIAGLADIYGRMRRVLKPGTVAVVNVTNIKRADGLTPLAFDACRAISGVVRFEGEVVVCWTDDDRPFGFDHEYCLLFRNE